MPLNQAQRNHITPYIEHFFYGLTTDKETISALKATLERPLIPAAEEHKEVEEKLNPAEESFRGLFEFMAKPQEKIKKIKIYDESGKKDEEKAFEELNPEPIRVHDVIEFIIFYSLCCLHFHLEQTDDDDDFDLNPWLEEHGITQAELSTPWQLESWLVKTNTSDVLKENWDINTTLTLLNQCKNNIAFRTVEEAAGYDWTLPEFKGRIYDAKILPVVHKVADQEGRPLQDIITLDLHIQAYISPEVTLQQELPNFTPYEPFQYAIDTETSAQRRSRIANNHWQQESVKAIALEYAETYATDLILEHLFNVGIVEPPKPPTLAELFLQDFPVLANPMENALPTPPLSDDESKDEPVAPELSEAISSEAANEGSSEAATASSVSSLSSLEELSGDVSDNEEVESLLPNAKKLRTIPNDIDTKAAGMVLLTFQFYFDQFKAGHISIKMFETISAEEVEILSNSSIISLMRHHNLSINDVLLLQPHVRNLLTSAPFYFNHLQLNPDDLNCIKSIDAERAGFLCSLITNPLSQGKILLQTALSIPTLAFPIFKHVHYANYLSKHPEAIPLLQNIDSDQQTVLLDQTIMDMVEREVLTLPNALKLKIEHLPIIMHEFFKPLFVANKNLFTTLTSFSSKKIKLLLGAEIFDLIKLKILPAEKALSYTENQLNNHAQRNTLFLLRKKKISSTMVANFTPMFSRIVETEPYGQLLRTHQGSKPHPLFSFPPEKLEKLLWVAVHNLMILNIVHFDDIVSSEMDFIYRLCKDGIYNLLLERKITAKQVLKLTETTAKMVDTHYEWLENSDDFSQSDDYIPLKIWTKTLCDDLIKAYHNDLPSINRLHTYTSKRIQMIAAGEKISEEKLRAKTIELFIEFISEAIATKIRGISAEQIDAIYPAIQQTIADELSKSEQNWPEVFSTIAEQAHERLSLMSKAKFKTKLRPNALGLFPAVSSDVNAPQKAIEDFCTRLIYLAGVLQPYQVALSKKEPDSPRLHM